MPSGHPLEIYHLKFRLVGLRPPVWRRIAIRTDATFAELHTVIQAVMGWQDYHMHVFRLDDVTYGPPDEEGLNGDEQLYHLTDRKLNPGDSFDYTYDFGDNWVHDIKVEKILPADPASSYPVCLAGRGACPPEDIGGLSGYDEVRSFLADAASPYHAAAIKKLGQDFDPARFDRDAANAALDRAFSRGSGEISPRSSVSQ